MAVSRFLVAPTEPPLLQALGIITLLPESHGCDVLAITPTCRVGFQRKTPPDFLASLLDGRLQKQLGQISCSTLLTNTILIMEGKFSWTTSGTLASTYSQQSYTKANHRSLMVQIQNRGLSIVETDSLSDTVDAILSLTRNLSKTSHDSLLRRPKASAYSSWGVKTSSSWAMHILQSFDSIGPDRAKAIFDYFHTTPLAWSCTEEELTHVPGIGPTLARRLFNSLN